MLNGRKILLGVCGGIAAYKTAELVRRFRKAGAEVQVLMTPDAGRFITPLTLGTLSGREVLIEIFPGLDTEGSWTKHIELGLWADLFVVAPATAQTIAKLAHGHCDSMLTATALAVRCPMLVCPAMDHDMYLHPAVQRNLDLLRTDGREVMEPAHGELASGLVGTGRLPEPADIFQCVAEKLGAVAPLKGRTVLVTAGPTQEPIDPVRFITNHSTGTMGYALAAAAAKRGAEVTLVSGPAVLDTPPGVTRIDVTTAQDMHEAVQAHADSDFVLMAAAVADFAPAAPADHKLKKGDSGDAPTLTLKRNPDILAGLGAHKREGQCLVGFAMETEKGLQEAQRKLQSKNLDWIVLNNLHEPGAGFGTGTNRVTLISADGYTEALPVMPKAEVAEAILDRVI